MSEGEAEARLDAELISLRARKTAVSIQPLLTVCRVV